MICIFAGPFSIDHVDVYGGGVDGGGEGDEDDGDYDVIRQQQRITTSAKTFVASVFRTQLQRALHCFLTNIQNKEMVSAGTYCTIEDIMCKRGQVKLNRATNVLSKVK